MAVVVADDNPDDLFFARRSLEKPEVASDILTCIDGRQVVALLEKRTADNQPWPRVIFLDVTMSVLSRLETLTWIRSDEVSRTVPPQARRILGKARARMALR